MLVKVTVRRIFERAKTNWLKEEEAIFGVHSCATTAVQCILLLQPIYYCDEKFEYSHVVHTLGSICCSQNLHIA